MHAFKRSLVLALSIVVYSTIGFAGCSSNSNNGGGTGGASAAGGSNGSGGSSMGGSTGAGGKTDAGSDVRTDAGGSRTDGGSNCAALLACCNSATPAQTQAGLKAQCLTAYNMAMPMGDGACGSVLSTIKTNGLCN